MFVIVLLGACGIAVIVATVMTFVNALSG